MLWIEASIAFAAIMMVFSTLVSVVIETTHRIFRVREQGLRQLIKSIYEDVMLPRMKHCDVTHTDSSVEFQNFMTTVRYVPFRESPTLWRRMVNRIINVNQLTYLGTAEFIERLAETPEGKALHASDDTINRDRLRLFLEDLASKYEDFGQCASEFFRRRASLFSIFVSFFLVIIFNINALDVFKSLLFESAWNNGIAPIGWNNAPWNAEAWVSAESLLTTMTSNLRALILWLTTLLFSGLLIGLGGPFWFDLYKKLSGFAEIKKSFQSDVQKSKSNASVNLLQVFEKAIQANAHRVVD